MVTPCFIDGMFQCYVLCMGTCIQIPDTEINFITECPLYTNQITDLSGQSVPTTSVGENYSYLINFRPNIY